MGFSYLNGPLVFNGARIEATPEGKPAFVSVNHVPSNDMLAHCGTPGCLLQGTLLQRSHLLVAKCQHNLAGERGAPADLLMLPLEP
jgi:hypothetical protein